MNEEEKYFMKPSEVVELFKQFKTNKKDTKNPRRDNKPNAQKRPRNHDGLPLMERCQIILGRRMKEVKGVGYTLDGVHVSCERIIKEAKLFGLL